MKSLSAENIRRRVERAPMLKVLVPLIVGIALADGCTLPLWGVAIGFVVCTVTAIALPLRDALPIWRELQRGRSRGGRL